MSYYRSLFCHNLTEEFYKTGVVFQVFKTFIVFKEGFILKAEFNRFLERLKGFIFFFYTRVKTGNIIEHFRVVRGKFDCFLVSG